MYECTIIFYHKQKYILVYNPNELCLDGLYDIFNDYNNDLEEVNEALAADYDSKLYEYNEYYI